MALLEVKDLRIYYETSKGMNQAVDGISFSVDEGKSICLVGESGCGKSTTVNGIIQVMPKNAKIISGEIIFNGEDLLKISNKRLKEIQWRDMSLIPQAAMDSLNPVYKVIDPFIEILRIKGGMSKKIAVRRIDELFKMVGLDIKRAQYYPFEFSGGMKQRAVIALALVLNPKLVIADEPVTALDVIIQKQILVELGRIRKQFGLALVMITHDISVAKTFDDIVIMYAGKIFEKGSSYNVLKTPIHPYTMGLENAFPSLDDDKKTLISIEGTPPHLVNPPKGCRFADRCPFSKDICFKEEPILVEVETGHFSACHFISDIKEIRRKAMEVETWLNMKS